MASQTILIGDVHGCSRELTLLLGAIKRPTRVIFLGDLVNKGPDPAGVVRIVQTVRALCVRGNHENDHLNWRAGLKSPKPETVRTRSQMPPDLYESYLNMAANMPLLIEDKNFVAVHGGLLPNLPLASQPAAALMGELLLPATWKDEIALRRPLVVGHKRYSPDQKIPFIAPGKFYGIDTGCVYGGALTAVSLPSGKVWQILAARNYSRDIS